MSQRSKKTRTRREFLADGARLAAGAALGGLAGCFPDVGCVWPPLEPACTPSPATPALVADGKVVEVHSGSVQGAYNALSGKYDVVPEVVRAMLDAALATLAGTSSPWRTLLDPLPSDLSTLTIGLKINTLGGKLSTEPELVKAVVDSLKSELGLSAAQIIVWDRTMQELSVLKEQKLNPGFLGASVQGTWASASDPSGPGYDDAMCGFVASKAPKLSRIHTALSTFTINCPVMKRHTVSGMTGAMKNIYGIIDNPADYHAPTLQTALPQLYALPLVGPRIRLNILDALNIVTQGDTSSSPDAFAGRILVARDVVAIDSRGFDLINEVIVENATKRGLTPRPIPAAAVGWLDNATAGKVGQRTYSLVPVEV